MARNPPVEQDIVLSFKIKTERGAEERLPSVAQASLARDAEDLAIRAHARAVATGQEQRAKLVTHQGHQINYTALAPAQLDQRLAMLRAEMTDTPELRDRAGQFGQYFSAYARARRRGAQPGALRDRQRILAEFEQHKDALLNELAPEKALANVAERRGRAGDWEHQANRLLGRHRTQAMLLGRGLDPEAQALEAALAQMRAGSPGSSEYRTAHSAAKSAFARLKESTTLGLNAPLGVVENSMRTAERMGALGQFGANRIDELVRRINDPATSNQERVRATRELERLNTVGGAAGMARMVGASANLAGVVAQHAATWTPEARAANQAGADEADRQLARHVLKVEEENAKERKELNKSERQAQREDEAEARRRDMEDQVSRGQRLSNAILGRSIAGRASGFLSSVASANGMDLPVDVVAGGAKTLTGTAADITMGRYIAGSGGPVAMAAAFAADVIVGGIASFMKRGQALQSQATEARSQRLMGLGQIFPGEDHLPEFEQTAAEKARQDRLIRKIPGWFEEDYKQERARRVKDKYASFALDRFRNNLDSTRRVAHARFSDNNLISAGAAEQAMGLLSGSGVVMSRFAKDYDVGPGMQGLSRMFGVQLPSFMTGSGGPLMSGYGIGYHMANVATNTGLDMRTVAALTAAGAGGRSNALKVGPDGQITSAAGALGGLVQNGMVTMPAANQVGGLLAEMVSRGYQGDIGKNISFLGNLGAAGIDVRHTGTYTQNLLNMQQSPSSLDKDLLNFAAQMPDYLAMRGGGTRLDMMKRRSKQTAGDLNSVMSEFGSLGEEMKFALSLTGDGDAARAAGVGDSPSSWESFKRIAKGVTLTTELANETRLNKESKGVSAADEIKAARIEIRLDNIADSLAKAARALGVMAGTGQ